MVASDPISTGIFLFLERAEKLRIIIQRRFLPVYIWSDGVSARKMANYQTIRLLVCCALDRIWSSTQ